MDKNQYNIKSIGQTGGITVGQVNIYKHILLKGEVDTYYHTKQFKKPPVIPVYKTSELPESLPVGSIWIEIPD